MFGKLDLKPNPENELNLAGGCILVKKFISQLPSLQDRLAQNNLDAEQLDLWRESRNQFIHQMVHGGCPVAPGIRPKEYYLRGAQVARTGKKIARVISDWAKKETRRIESTRKKSNRNRLSRPREKLTLPFVDFTREKGEKGVRLGAVPFFLTPEFFWLPRVFAEERDTPGSYPSPASICLSSACWPLCSACSRSRQP